MRSLTLRSTGSGHPTVLAIAKHGMKGDETTGINQIDGNLNVNGSLNGNADIVIYSVNGQRLSTLQPGINIVRYGNGTVKKILVK